MWWAHQFCFLISQLTVLVGTHVVGGYPYVWDAAENPEEEEVPFQPTLAQYVLPPVARWRYRLHVTHLVSIVVRVCAAGNHGRLRKIVSVVHLKPDYKPSVVCFAAVAPQISLIFVAGPPPSTAPTATPAVRPPLTRRSLVVRGASERGAC